jgi:hypothetical protein
MGAVRRERWGQGPYKSPPTPPPHHPHPPTPRQGLGRGESIVMRYQGSIVMRAKIVMQSEDQEERPMEREKEEEPPLPPPADSERGA